MTCIQNQPEDFATTALAGFSSIYARYVRPVRSGVVRSTATPTTKVAVVVGGVGAPHPGNAEVDRIDEPVLRYVCTVTRHLDLQPCLRPPAGRAHD